eukprot:TRINITY_DN16327_c0_g1_i1.p1 TRINITY_DN16327_c0_g1~~TRINITY_DN16327_c0_g1_i1.p1  ORF type:complete len:1330 (+),score=352.82 TRINITY_DN16327_c0_g1_i1:173-4162(+)
MTGSGSEAGSGSGKGASDVPISELTEPLSSSGGGAPMFTVQPPSDAPSGSSSGAARRQGCVPCALSVGASDPRAASRHSQMSFFLSEPSQADQTSPSAAPHARVNSRVSYNSLCLSAASGVPPPAGGDALAPSQIGPAAAQGAADSSTPSISAPSEIRSPEEVAVAADGPADRFQSTPLALIAQAESATDSNEDAAALLPEAASTPEKLPGEVLTPMAAPLPASEPPLNLVPILRPPPRPLTAPRPDSGRADSASIGGLSPSMSSLEMRSPGQHTLERQHSTLSASSTAAVDPRKRQARRAQASLSTRVLKQPSPVRLESATDSYYAPSPGGESAASASSFARRMRDGLSPADTESINLLSSGDAPAEARGGGLQLSSFARRMIPTGRPPRAAGSLSARALRTARGSGGAAEKGAAAELPGPRRGDASATPSTADLHESTDRTLSIPSLFPGDYSYPFLYAETRGDDNDDRRSLRSLHTDAGLGDGYGRELPAPAPRPPALGWRLLRPVVYDGSQGPKRYPAFRTWVWDAVMVWAVVVVVALATYHAASGAFLGGGFGTGGAALGVVAAVYGPLSVLMMADVRERRLRSSTTKWTFLAFDILPAVPLDLIFLAAHAGTGAARWYVAARAVGALRLGALGKLLHIGYNDRSAMHCGQLPSRYVKYRFDFSGPQSTMASLCLGAHVSACAWMLLRRWVGAGDESYLSALYFIVQTLTSVGYGDVELTTVYEKLFACCLFVFNLGINALAIGTLTVYLNRANIRLLEAESMLVTQQAGESVGLPPPLLSEMVHVQLFHMLTEPLTLFPSVVNRLPHEVRSVIVASVRGSILKEVRRFAEYSEPHLLCLGEALHVVTVAPQEMLLIRGEQVDMLYILGFGTVWVIDAGKGDDGAPRVIKRKLGAGDCFGDEAWQAEGSPVSVRTITSCVCYTVARHTFAMFEDMFCGGGGDADGALASAHQRPPSAGSDEGAAPTASPLIGCGGSKASLLNFSTGTETESARSQSFGVFGGGWGGSATTLSLAVPRGDGSRRISKDNVFDLGGTMRHRRSVVSFVPDSPRSFRSQRRPSGQSSGSSSGSGAVGDAASPLWCSASVWSAGSPGFARRERKCSSSGAGRPARAPVPAMGDGEGGPTEFPVVRWFSEAAFGQLYQGLYGLHARRVSRQNQAAVVRHAAATVVFAHEPSGSYSAASSDLPSTASTSASLTPPPGSLRPTDIAALKRQYTTHIGGPAAGSILSAAHALGARAETGLGVHTFSSAAVASMADPSPSSPSPQQQRRSGGVSPPSSPRLKHRRTSEILGGGRRASASHTPLRALPLERADSTASSADPSIG